MSYEENIRKVVPYVAGEQPKDKTIIKLNTNENPYPPSPAVQRAMKELSENKEFPDTRLYPDMDAAPLVDALAKKYGRNTDEIYVGVGSDDVLSMCFLTFFNSDKPVFFPDITYSFYDVWADLYRIPYKKVPLDDDLSIRKEDYLGENAKANGGVIFPNPNAPTGILMPVSDIEEIIAANSGSIVIIDEAYIDFGGESVMPLIDKYDNLIVVQTFSKSRAMAGMRIGFAVSNAKLIKYLRDVKFSFNSYTMNLPSIVCGAEAVKDDEYFREITGRIIKTRDNFEKELRRLGFSFRDSGSNFVFCTHPRMSGKEIFTKLRDRNIYVRWWDRDRIRGYLRITIGTDEQMENVVKALEEIL